MSDIIIAIDRKLDKIIIENEHEYSAFITIGLEKGNDFYVKLEFIDLTLNDVKTLRDLFKAPKALEINSNIITNEQFNITHIVIEKFNSDQALNVTLECVSDDPDYSLIL